MEDSKTIKTFNLIGGIILFVFGLAIEVKNIFVASVPNGYELIFGVEFITAGVFLAYGKFKGFGKLNEKAPN